MADPHRRARHRPAIPQIIQAKFARAQTLYLLGWIDFTLIKAGELAALVALELAVMDRLGGKVSKGKRNFANLLKHMVEVDRLTDSGIPMVTRCNGTAIGQLTGVKRTATTVLLADKFER